MVGRYNLATKSVGLCRHQSSCLWVFEVFAHRGQATTLPTVEGAAATVPAPPPPPPSLFSCPGCPLTIVMIIGIVIIIIITLQLLPLGKRFRFILSYHGCSIEFYSSKSTHLFCSYWRMPIASVRLRTIQFIKTYYC